MSQRMWYEEYVQELEAEQKGKSSADVERILKQKRDETGQPIFNHVFNPDTAAKQTHRWVDRGLKLSCEGAGHPYHQSYKQK